MQNPLNDPEPPEKSPEELGAELERLLAEEDAAADGVPDGLGETEAALFDFILENGSAIANYLNSWDQE